MANHAVSRNILQDAAQVLELDLYYVNTRPKPAVPHRGMPADPSPEPTYYFKRDDAFINIDVIGGQALLIAHKAVELADPGYLDKAREILKTRTCDLLGRRGDGSREAINELRCQYDPEYERTGDQIFRQHYAGLKSMLAQKP
jgi:hypothetical protein